MSLYRRSNGQERFPSWDRWRSGAHKESSQHALRRRCLHAHGDELRLYVFGKVLKFLIRQRGNQTKRGPLRSQVCGQERGRYDEDVGWESKITRILERYTQLLSRLNP